MIKKIDPNICIGCGICVLSCPMDVIRMDKKTEKANISYPEDCQLCYICKNLCPENEAITISPYKCVRPMVGWG